MRRSRASIVTPTRRETALRVEASARRVMGYYFRHGNGKMGKIVGFIIAHDPPLRYIVLPDGAGGLEIVLPGEITVIGLEIRESQNATVATFIA